MNIFLFPIFRQPWVGLFSESTRRFVAVYLNTLLPQSKQKNVKPLGFAWLQPSAVSKKVGDLPSWPIQLDSPGTALTVGRCGSLLGVKTSGVGRGLFDTTPSLSSSVH